MSSPDRIAEHHKKWDALPPFPDYPYVMTDDDVESWSDLLYFRGLADAIEDQAAKLAPELIAVHEVQARRMHSTTDVDVLTTTPVPAGLLMDWPDDVAADMLAAWRDGYDYLRAPVPGAQWVLGDRVPPVAESNRPPWWRRTLHKRTLRRLGFALAIAALVIVGIGYATAPAKADPGLGCETIRWGLFGAQRRTVCDTPRRPDGSWTRAREVWVPAGVVQGYCSFGRYYSSCSPSYYRERGTVAYEEYPVTDDTVLPDEPGWLPTGSVVIR